MAGKTTKGIAITASSIIIILAAIYGGMEFGPDSYYCESKDIFMECVRFSGTGGRCYPSLTTTSGYKDCTEGWTSVGEISKLTTTTIISTTTLKIDDKPKLKQSSIYLCGPEKCKEVKETMEPFNLLELND